MSGNVSENFRGRICEGELKQPSQIKEFRSNEMKSIVNFTCIIWLI